MPKDGSKTPTHLFEATFEVRDLLLVRARGCLESRLGLFELARQAAETRSSVCHSPRANDE